MVHPNKPPLNFREPSKRKSFLPLYMTLVIMINMISKVIKAPSLCYFLLTETGILPMTVKTFLNGFPVCKVQKH